MYFDLGFVREGRELSVMGEGKCVCAGMIGDR